MKLTWNVPCKISNFLKHKFVRILRRACLLFGKVSRPFLHNSPLYLLWPRERQTHLWKVSQPYLLLWPRDRQVCPRVRHGKVLQRSTSGLSAQKSLTRISSSVCKMYSFLTFLAITLERKELERSKAHFRGLGFRVSPGSGHFIEWSVFWIWKLTFRSQSGGESWTRQ